MKRILIVEDEKRMRYMYKALLIAEGYTVFDAPNSDLANEVLKKEHIDLVLLDINLPEVNGDRLYDIIRLIHPRAKVIVTSVYPLEKQQRLIRGANAYYDKAEGITALLDKICEVVDEQYEINNPH